MTQQHDPGFDLGDTQPMGSPAVIVAVAALPVINFVASPHCQRLSRQRTQAITIHATDGNEGRHKAEQVAAMLAQPDLKPRRSAHYVVDGDSIVQCVSDLHSAWHCGKHGNQLTIGIELCGRAKQTRAEWLDAESLPMLQLAARLVAELCKRRGLPRQYVDARGLLAGSQGITTHKDVGEAWKETTHRDPGPSFPLLDFIAAVQRA